MDVIDCQEHSPFRPVDWRWRRAGLVLADPALKRPGGLDPWTARALRHLGAPAAGGAPAPPDPDVHGARAFRGLGDAPPRWELEARLLAGEGDDAVAARFGISPGAVAAYEALFFHVRDRLAAPSYITHFAIGRAAARGPRPHELDVLWKLFGYHGGPRVLDAVVTPFAGLGRPGGPADLPGYFAALLRACVRRAAAVAALSLRVTPGNAVAVLRLYARAEGRGAARRLGGRAPDVAPNLRAFSGVLDRAFGAALRATPPAGPASPEAPAALPPD